VTDVEFQNLLLKEQIGLLEEKIRLLTENLKDLEEVKRNLPDGEGLVAFVSAGVLGIMLDDCPAAVALYRDVEREYDAMRHTLKHTFD